MVCLGLEPGAAGWKAQTNPLSYGGTPKQQTLLNRMKGPLVSYQMPTYLLQKLQDWELSFKKMHLSIKPKMPGVPGL